MIGIGIVGAGYWGPKHVRNFSEIAGASVAMVADLSEARLGTIRAQYSNIPTTTDFSELLNSPSVDAVVIATPVSTHAKLAAEALQAGKHVLVEKPLAASSEECETLVALAAKHRRILMVGHTFLYNPAVIMLRELVQSGEIGEVYYAHAQRLNLGLFQRDINVLWDLAPHDLSILMYVLGADPSTIAARGSAHVRDGIEDVAYMEVCFPGGVSAGVQVSWLDPNKVRRVTLIGSKKMVVYDDVEAQEKIRLFDKGVDVPAGSARIGDLPLAYRNGAISIPPISGAEPLRLECEHFLDCIRTGAAPRSGGDQGLRVVQALEMADRSLANGGAVMSMPRPMLGGSSALAVPLAAGNASGSALSRELALVASAGD